MRLRPWRRCGPDFADPTDDTSPAIEWTMPAGRTTASLRAGTALHPTGDWDTRRFRPNLLVDIDTDGWIEDGWRGYTLHITRVTIVPRQPCIRCGHPPTALPRTRPRHLPDPQPTPRLSACGRKCTHPARFTSATLSASRRPRLPHRDRPGQTHDDQGSQCKAGVLRGLLKEATNPLPLALSRPILTVGSGTA